MKMIISYNVTGKKRKKLADDISEALHALPRYMMYPTCNYEIGDCILDRNGKLTIPENLEDTTVKALLEHLKDRGYQSNGVEDIDKFTISLPRKDFTEGQLEMLVQMVRSKEGLFKRAFRTDSVDVMTTADCVCFPWFTLTDDPAEAEAYTTFISKLSEMACRQKRVLATTAAGDNDKYAMRCYLLRLGFIGEQYKRSRAILLKNLSGNSAFRFSNP